MKTPSAGFAVEGLPFVLLIAFVTGIFALLGWEILACAGLVALVLTGHFFRDPVRVIPTDRNVAVAPADGTVCHIGMAADPLTGEQRQRLCIFMNVFNVHVNRVPVAGEITRIVHTPGDFINAARNTASEVNERCAVGIREKNGREWTMVQIAGLIARRIVCRAQEKETVLRGQRMGLIRFGSRVDLYLPVDYTVEAGEGQRVVAGQTIVARKKDRDPAKK